MDSSNTAEGRFIIFHTHCLQSWAMICPLGSYFGFEQENVGLTKVVGHQLSIVDFAVLSESQRSSVRDLKISSEQVEFGGSFDRSVDQIMSQQNDTFRGFCFLWDEQAIGLVILKRPLSAPDWVEEDAVSLHGLKIDSRWQGKGIGKIAFELAVNQAATQWPEARQLVLAVDAENAVALAVYRRLGMKDSGPIFDGRIGKEHRLSISFHASS